MNQQLLVLMLKENPQAEGTRKMYREINELYVNEYGLGWVLKEMDEARGVIARLLSTRKVRTVWAAVEYAFKEADEPKERITRKYIMNKEVNQNDFALYSKGLYWLAGYDLLNEM